MKGFKYVIMLFLVLMLSGCGEETLTCQKSEKSDAGKMSESHTIVFKNDEIKLYNASVTVDLSEKYIDYTDMFMENLESAFDDLKDQDGITYKSNKDNGVITISISGNYDKMNQESKDNLGFSDADSYDSVKKEFEENEYTCK